MDFDFGIGEERRKHARAKTAADPRLSPATRSVRIPASIVRPPAACLFDRTGNLDQMGCTRLAPEPNLVVTRLGRERMLAALQRLYQVLEIDEPPRMEDYWIVIPADPALVYLGLQRSVPDWFELFVVPRSQESFWGSSRQ
jgi:hypothetical protein